MHHPCSRPACFVTILFLSGMVSLDCISNSQIPEQRFVISGRMYAASLMDQMPPYIGGPPQPVYLYHILRSDSSSLRIYQGSPGDTAGPFVKVKTDSLGFFRNEVEWPVCAIRSCMVIIALVNFDSLRADSVIIVDTLPAAGCIYPGF